MLESWGTYNWPVNTHNLHGTIKKSRKTLDSVLWKTKRAMNDLCAPSEGQPLGWRGCQPCGISFANHNLCEVSIFLIQPGHTPVPLPAIFPHKPTTTTDCYIDMMFFNEQFKVHSDGAKNIFLYPSLEPNYHKSLDMYGQVRRISRILSLLTLQQSL